MSVTPVIGVAVPDKPGGLADVLKILKDADINVEYVYAFITISGKNACVVLRVGDNEKAVKILKEAGVELLTEDFIKQL